MHALAAAIVLALHPVGGSHAAGTATLRPVGPGTTAAVRLRGLAPRAPARVVLQAGSCAHPSASFALVAELRAGVSGAARATAAIRFHGTAPVALQDVTDGAHVIRVLAGGRAVACGTIPRP